MALPHIPAVRTTYKRAADLFPPHARPSSPESPAYEPLSPARPAGPVFDYPAVARSKSSSRASPAKPRRQPPAQNGRAHHRSPSAIEALADAALSTSPQPPTHRSPPAQYPPPDSARAAKRARSDAGPQPHPYPFPGRPASSHHLPETNGFPLTYNLDRQRRQSTNTTTPVPTNPLEDAELLLNFASRVTARPAVPEAHPRAPVLAPSALPPPPPYPTFASAVGHAPRLSGPADANSSPPENPSASLPSPQGTNEDDKSLETENEGHPVPIPPYRPSDIAPPPVAAVPDSQRSLPPQQTHTPPEEERLALDLSIPGPATVSRQDGSETWSASVESQPTSEAPAARPRRGWPKGKPRGPRNKNSIAAKPRSSTRRSRASTAKSGTESGDSSAEEKKLRRKSDPALPLFNVAQSQPRNTSVPPSLRYEILTSAPRSKSVAGRKLTKEVAPETVCASCSQTRESSHGELDQWISCNGCKLWFHFDCAGFKNERDVRDVDKFFCKTCEPQHGPTTFVRKSSRAHAAVDYAGLNQGILKTSDDNPEHHYIQPIKDGSFTFDPETFPRMRPELVTRSFFETSTSFSEPVVIPAEFNPRLPEPQHTGSDDTDDTPIALGFRNAQEEDDLTSRFEYEAVSNDGQDRLDMVVPRNLTVRQVAQLVGPDEPLEVIDVKTQGTEGKWNLQKWADYYEADGEKAVRNVISLEVSATKLGRLLRRPKVVRDIDLQDSVWPEEETAKGNYPKVQFYCLMSVADSFTDFHIDFGGSSVYYHILRGKKTFFFIPPKPGHLKKYEDWNNSHEQNFTWLPDATKECYRVDLSEGDTMLIPSGWIHAVWTPDNSLVIGGNFLTRMHYSTQFRIVDIEKAIKTPQKFRYPHFQKVMWYSIIKYLETDPLPAEVAETFYSGARFPRERPIWQEFEVTEPESTNLPGTAGYNARYYSQTELDGLPELIKFIFRTVMISFGKVEGVSEDTRKKVTRSIPKSHGEPLELAKKFALWVAWKRGNEDPPAWAHPEADLPDKESAAPKKLSARALKMMQRQEAFDAYKIAPERQSTRQQASREANSVPATSPAPSAPPQPSQTPAAQGSQHTSTPKTSVLGPKRVACDACRKRRIKCKHKDVVTTTTPVAPPAMLFQSNSSFEGGDPSPAEIQRRDSRELFANPTEITAVMTEQPDHVVGVAPVAQMTAPDGSGPALIAGNALLADPNSKRGRSKACLDCRKSKRRCIHDENGKIDPVKAEQTPVPRGSATSKKRRISGEVESPSKKIKHQARPLQNFSGLPFTMGAAYQPNMVSPQQYKPVPYQEANIPHWQHANYLYPDPTDADGNVVATGGPYHQQPDLHASFSAQSLEQLANEVLDSRFVNDGDYTVPQPIGDAVIHPALRQSSVPNHDAMQAQLVSPLLGKSRPSNSAGCALPDQGNVAIEKPTANNEAQRRPSSSGGSVQAPNTDSLAVNVPFLPPTNTEAPMPRTNGFLTTGGDTEAPATVNNQTKETTPHRPAPAVQEPVAVPTSHDSPNGQPVEANPPPKEIISPRPAVAPKSGLNNIPLYEPPPSVVRRSTSQVPRQSASGNPDVPFGQPRRSLSRTPAPPVQTIEQRTPGSRKRKADSTTPSTTKSRKTEHMPREMSAVEEEEEQSLRLARELQDQDWGLRRRSRQLG